MLSGSGSMVVADLIGPIWAVHIVSIVVDKVMRTFYWVITLCDDSIDAHYHCVNVFCAQKRCYSFVADLRGPVRAGQEQTRLTASVPVSTL